MSIFAKAKKARENKKGFTLVELIVVLVILAILAAMLVPALLGWIDEARNKQYVLEARSVYMAAQALDDERYAAGEAPIGKLDIADCDRISTLSDVNVTNLVVTKAKTGNPPRETGYAKDDYAITGMTVNFLSSDSKQIEATLSESNWEIKDVTHGASATPSPSPTE